MKDFLRSFFGSLFAIVFLLLVVLGVLALKARETPKIKSGSYLIVDIYGEIMAYNPPDELMAEIFGSQPETLHRILGNLEKAAVDDHIAGVIMKISSNNTLGSASVGEIRNAIKAVRASGKPVYAYSDAINRKGLLIAAACDSVYMPAQADVFFAGFGATYAYVKGTLDKLGIRPNIHRIDEYKSAAEMVTREDMSDKVRENRNQVLDDIWDTYVSGFREDRGIPEERLVELMDIALFSAEQAREAGLIDHVRYWDALVDGLKDEGDETLRTVSQSAYAKIKPSKLGFEGEKKIAVVHAQGQIGGRSSYIDPMLGLIMGHESIRAQLDAVRRDDDIAAVVFRVDSPGGEALASDLIGHEVAAVAEEKPVVASMIDVAASGGYSISYRATKIVADPMTITGSIGSIHGKMNTAGLYNKIGITFDYITKGPSGLFWSPNFDFTPEERAKLEAYHWESFNDWLEDIAAVRGIDMDRLRELSMGRIWTGNQARANGLVDDVGGLDRAIALAKELAEIPADEKVTIVHYPKKKGLYEMITGGGGAKAALRWALYRYIREDLEQSVRLLTSEALRLDTELSR